MTSPLIRLIIWTTKKVYVTVMKRFPKPLISVPGAHERYVQADCDFLRIAVHADLTSYRIAQTLVTSYVHAPLCPLPAELSYLVPILTWDCLATVYQQVRLMTAERRDIGNITTPRYYGPTERPARPGNENFGRILMSLADDFAGCVKLDRDLDNDDHSLDLSID